LAAKDKPERRRRDGLQRFSLDHEETLEEVTALFGHQAPDDLWTVVRTWVAEQVIDRTGHTATGVVGPKDDPADLGQYDRSSALGAWLESDIECGEGQAVLAHFLEGLLHRKELRMRSGIPPLHGLIMGFAQDLTVGNDDGTHGNLFPDGRSPR
jgi:hypothetical protein